jgi:hypothetical protein
MSYSYRYDHDHQHRERVKLVIIGLTILTLGALGTWTCQSYRHDIATITGMSWETCRRIQYKNTVTNSSMDSKGNTTYYTNIEWVTRKIFKLRGGRNDPIVFPATPGKRWGERIISSQTYHILMTGKVDGRLHYSNDNRDEWSKYEIKDRVYVTLFWRKTVWAIKPYKMEGR